MKPNRFSYLGAGAGYPYVVAKAAFDVQPNTYIELQAFTDGGSIWKENTHNDWRSVTILHEFDTRLAMLRMGVGVVQTEERVVKQSGSSFGVAPQMAIYLPINGTVGLDIAFSYPISPATELSPAMIFGVQYRLGRYVKENGLYFRRGRPLF
jgi:hypothetical protein